MLATVNTIPYALIIGSVVLVLIGFVLFGDGRTWGRQRPTRHKRARREAREAGRHDNVIVEIGKHHDHRTRT